MKYTEQEVNQKIEEAVSKAIMGTVRALDRKNNSSVYATKLTAKEYEMGWDDPRKFCSKEK